MSAPARKRQSKSRWRNAGISESSALAPNPRSLATQQGVQDTSSVNWFETPMTMSWYIVLTKKEVWSILQKTTWECQTLEESPGLGVARCLGCVVMLSFNVHNDTNYTLLLRYVQVWNHTADTTAGKASYYFPRTAAIDLDLFDLRSLALSRLAKLSMSTSSGKSTPTYSGPLHRCNRCVRWIIIWHLTMFQLSYLNYHLTLSEI